MFENIFKHKDHFDYAYEGEKALLNKKYKQALNLYNKSISLAEKENIKHIDLYYSSRASIKNKINDIQGALDDINKAISAQPNVYMYYYDRALLRKKLQDNKGASEDLKTITEILDKNGSSHVFKLYLAKNAFDTGYYKKAADILEKEEDNIHYNSEKIILFRRQVYDSMKDYNNSLRMSDKLLEIVPDRADYKYHKTWTLMKLKRYNEALQEINEAIKIDSAIGRFYFTRAYIYNSLHNKQECLNSMETALKYQLTLFQKKIAILTIKKIRKKLNIESKEI